MINKGKLAEMQGHKVTSLSMRGKFRIRWLDCRQIQFVKKREWFVL